MQRCPELRRLSSTSRLTSVLFRGQTPGSPATLLDPKKPQPCKAPKSQLLAPKHPSTSSQRKDFPSFYHSALRIVAHPFAVLDKPDDASKEPIAFQLARVNSLYSAKDNIAHLADTLCQVRYADEKSMSSAKAGTRVPMSLLFSSSKKKVSKQATIRNEIKRRIKTAINLIVVRGADVASDPKGQLRLVLSQKTTTQNRWILQGWSYVFHPTLEIYRMPYPSLVKLLRSALRLIWQNGMAKERTWSGALAKMTKTKVPKMVTMPSSTSTTVKPHIKVETDTASELPLARTQAGFDANRWRWDSPGLSTGQPQAVSPKIDSLELFADKPAPDAPRTPLFERLAHGEDVAASTDELELTPLPERRNRLRPKLFFESPKQKEARASLKVNVALGGPLESLSAQDSFRAYRASSLPANDADAAAEGSSRLFRHKSLILNHRKSQKH